MIDQDFFKGKRVFITGHTGFKGIWLSEILLLLGANVTGFSLPSPTAEGKELFLKLQLEKRMQHVQGDIRDYEALMETINAAKPEIVIHLAAQPLVITSYEAPKYTYETNVMGTVNILECIRNSKSVKSFLNVTTDKVYLNREQSKGYTEDEPLDGFDPYSNSKSCSELVTHSYKNSFFSDGRVAISTARAGNVIGGGDFSKNRIIPDCVRAAYNGATIQVRNPHSIRPYQHVLEPLFAYLMIVESQYKDSQKAGYYNVGPDECDCVTTGELVELFCKAWGESLSWECVNRLTPHEANFLKLNSTKLKEDFQWQPHWHIEESVNKTVEWAKAWKDGDDIDACMKRQVQEYMDEVKK